MLPLALFTYQFSTLCNRVSQIILYTAKDHPHHSLYIVLAMGNAPKDDEYPLRGYVCGSRKAKSRRTSTAGGGGGSHSVDEVKMPLKLDCK